MAMQRHTISKSALLHQTNVLCCTITKIIEDCAGREPNSLISTWLQFDCQSETETWQVLKHVVPDLRSSLIVYYFKFDLEGYIIDLKKKKISEERPIDQREFNLKFYHILNPLSWSPSNQDITFLYM